MNQTQKPNWLVIVLIAALVFFIFRSFNQDAPDPGPGPGPQPIPNNVSEVVEKASNQYNILLAQDMELLASEVGARVLGSSKALQDRARELTSKSRQDAFLPVSELDNKFIPMEITEDNSSSVYNYLMEKSKGHAKAGK